MIDLIRKQLKAKSMPEAIRPVLDTLDKQLRNWANGNDEDRAALRPVIQDSLRKIERGADVA